MPVHLQVGKEKKVAVVFSCPGRREELAGYPAARHTGRNLELLLSLLARELNRDDLSRGNITISNAWPRVEYRAKTGRSEATLKEVESADNVKRLQHELEEVTDFVIFCGARAKAAARHLQLGHKPRLVFIRHPGLRGLSLMATDLRGERILAAELQLSRGSNEAKRSIQAENTRRRLAVLVDSILKQLEDDPEASAG
jgi:hypothetical protein